MEHLTLCIDRENGRPLFVDREGKVATSAPSGTPLRMDYPRPFSTIYSKVEDSSLVERLPPSTVMPTQKIKQMSTGTLEQYAAELGFTDPQYSPDEPTVALWIMMQEGAMAGHEYLYGGKFNVMTCRVRITSIIFPSSFKYFVLILWNDFYKDVITP